MALNIECVPSLEDWKYLSSTGDYVFENWAEI